MSICGNGVIDWWTIGLMVSLVVILVAWAGLWLWKLMGPKLRLTLPVVLFLLMAGVATVEAQKAGRGNAPPRLPQVGESGDDAQNRSSGVLQNCESLDCDRFTEINVTTNGVALTLHRPITNALEAVEVTVAGSTNLVSATWEAYTNVVFAAGVTNVEVFVSREMMAAHSVSNVNFFAFIQSGDSDGDGLADWHERFNLKTDPFNPFSVMEAYVASTNGMSAYAQSFRDDFAVRFGGRFPNESLADGRTVYEHALYAGAWNAPLSWSPSIGSGEVSVSLSVNRIGRFGAATLHVGDVDVPLAPNIVSTVSLAIPVNAKLPFSLSSDDPSENCQYPHCCGVAFSGSTAFLVRRVDGRTGEEIQTGYTYDERLLCTNEVMSIGAVSFSLTRSFDSFRRVETTAAEYGSQFAKNTRIYDSENRVSGHVLGEAGPNGHLLAVEIGYQGHCPTGIVYTLPNNGGTFNVLLSRQPGHRDWVTERRYFMNDNVDTPLYLHQTTYDCKGRPTSTTDSLAATRQWLYNRRSELIGASCTSTIPYSYAYAYDSIGNRLASTENSIATTYTANNLNQYIAILRGSASPCEPTYDADGNLTQDDRYVYTYDGENRLVSVTPINSVYGDYAIENIYDHRNRRIRKIVRHYDGTAWNSADTHTFIWDGWNIVAEYISNADTTTHIIEYFWGNDLSGTEQGAGGVGGLLAVRLDGTFHIPVYDNNGNIVMYVSEAGFISAQYIYDPYGNIVQSTGPSASQLSFGFSTKYHDREVDLIPYQLRVYNPVHGRWLNRDPMGEVGGNNLYCYNHNDGIATVDLLGLVESEINPYFNGPCSEVPIARYVQTVKTEMRSYNYMGDFFSFIHAQKVEMKEYVYTLNFIARFTSPLRAPELPYAKHGRNALGGFEQMYRIDPSLGDIDKSVWGNGLIEFTEKSIAGYVLRQISYYPNSKVAFGYFVYKANDDKSPFRLIAQNDAMYQRWSIGLEWLPKKDMYFSGKRKPCEVVEIQFGDRGCRIPNRVRFQGRGI